MGLSLFFPFLFIYVALEGERCGKIVEAKHLNNSERPHNSKVAKSLCKHVWSVNAGNYNFADSSCFFPFLILLLRIIRWKLVSNHCNYDLHTVTYIYCNSEICLSQ